MFNVAQAYDWHTAYFAAAGVYVFIMALLFWQKDLLLTHVVARKHDEPQEHSLAFLKIPVIWWCFFFFFFSTMTLAVVQNFVVSILQHLYEVTIQAATMTLTAYLFCAAFGMFVGGFVAARFAKHSDRVVALCMLLGAICMALCASEWFNTDVTLVVLALTGLAIGVGGPSRDMMIKKATPKGATGRVYGMVYSGLDVGFAVSPLIFGYFMDHGWFAAALFGAAVSLLLSVVVALGVGKRTAH
jgi:predicted MFS family arabinose efflux permease